MLVVNIENSSISCVYNVDRFWVLRINGVHYGEKVIVPTNRLKHGSKEEIEYIKKIAKEENTYLYLTGKINNINLGRNT